MYNIKWKWEISEAYLTMFKKQINYLSTVSLLAPSIVDYM